MHVLITLIEYNAVNYVSYSVVNPGIIIIQNVDNISMKLNAIDQNS